MAIKSVQFTINGGRKKLYLFANRLQYDTPASCNISPIILLTDKVN